MEISQNDIRVSKLIKDDRTLYEAGWCDLDGFPTSTGWEILKGIVFDANKKALVDLAKSVGETKVENHDENDN